MNRVASLCVNGETLYPYGKRFEKAEAIARGYAIKADVAMKNGMPGRAAYFTRRSRHFNAKAVAEIVAKAVG